jgi:hypothetical protein
MIKIRFQKKKKKMRVKVIEYWIEVARECINLGNFNSLMGIITGLNMTPVSRLRRTWSKIQSAGKFAVLEHQVCFISLNLRHCLLLLFLKLHYGLCHVGNIVLDGIKHII